MLTPPNPFGAEVKKVVEPGTMDMGQGSVVVVAVGCHEIKQG